MIYCKRKIEFDAGHRVMGHQHKCKLLHGHRYTIIATFTAEKLDDLGMVVDFGDIKKILGKWIDDNWDHNTILHVEDKELGDNIANITKQNIYYLPYNPTAENMAKYILEEICPKLFMQNHLKCIEIEIKETPNCSAIAKL